MPAILPKNSLGTDRWFNQCRRITRNSYRRLPSCTGPVVLAKALWCHPALLPPCTPSSRWALQTPNHKGGVFGKRNVRLLAHPFTAAENSARTEQKRPHFFCVRSRSSLRCFREFFYPPILGSPTTYSERLIFFARTRIKYTFGALKMTHDMDVNLT